MRKLRLGGSFAGAGAGADGQGPASATAPPPPPLVVTPASASASASTAASQAAAQLTPVIASGSRNTNTASFVDPHAGLILAALLCAFAGALTLHSLLRCALHYCGGGRHRRGAGGTLSVAAPPPGLKRSALRRMPVAVYEAEAGASPGAECAICLGEFADGEAVRLLPRCRHGFHVRCIDVWLSKHSSCPICRDSLLQESATGDSEAATVAEGGERT